MTKPGARTKIENTGNIIAVAQRMKKREMRKKSLRSLIDTAATARNPENVHLNQTAKTGIASRGKIGMVCGDIVPMRILKTENSEMMGKFVSPLPYQHFVITSKL